MPINIPNNLPAFSTLVNENIFVISDEKASRQDIRPLKVAIVNLMPTKIVTETQLLRLLSNTPLQVDITLIKTETHNPKNISQEHLINFYTTFNEIKDQYFDALIITGAPVELLEFSSVHYWKELCDIMEWSKSHAFSTVHICWAAFAGLYYHYGIQKYVLDKKMFGVFRHYVKNRKVPLVRGFDDIFYAPHSRHTEVRKEDIEKCENLTILAESDEAGVFLVIDKTGKQIFVMGHPEYDRLTLDSEYKRDKNKGLPIDVPVNYYPNDDDTQKPVLTWRSHGNILYSNWLNYYVYQDVPYEFINTDLIYGK